MSLENRILIASDHAGMSLKAELQKRLPHFKWIDLGPTESNSVDYPDYAQLLGQRLLKEISAGEAAPLGVLICGSGIGMSMAANKIPGIRAALVGNPVAARLSREHNNANVLCLGSRFTAAEYGVEIVETWINTPFTQDPRHTKRIDKLHSLENS